MLDGGLTQMRDFIMVAESFRLDEYANEKEVVSSEVEEPARHPILDDLDALVDRLRNYMGDDMSERTEGMEAGMQLAAEWVENILKNHLEEATVG